MTLEERDKYYLQVINPQLQAIAIRICNASAADDAVLGEVAYQELLHLYDEECARGYWHPALTESMADFTSDDREAVKFYQRALKEAIEIGEQTHTILICMARRLHEIGNLEQAEASLRDGRAKAVVLQDDHWIDEAERVAKEWAGGSSS